MIIMVFIWHTAFPTGLPCSEIHLCGESSAINVVKRIVSSCNDEMEVMYSCIYFCSRD